MDSRNRYDGIDTYAVRIIRHKARRLIGKFGFTEFDIEDIEQELVLEVLRRLPKYNPKRAKLSTFIALVVEHKIATIIETRKAAMRDYRRCAGSLNDSLEDDEGGSTELIEAFDQEAYLFRTGKLSRPAAELRDLKIDLCKAIEKLPLELRELCRRLLTNTVTEVSRDTGIARGTIYDMIKKICGALKEAGLGDYL